MSEWKPIETVPKNGEHVLAWCETPTFDEDQNLTRSEFYQVVAYWVFGQMVEFPFRYASQGQKFLYWQPLPNPPARAKE